MNNSLVVYIEGKVFTTINNETILQRLQKMQTRLIKLPSLSRIPHTSGTSTSGCTGSSVHKYPFYFFSRRCIEIEVVLMKIYIMAPFYNGNNRYIG